MYAKYLMLPGAETFQDAGAGLSPPSFSPDENYTWVMSFGTGDITSFAMNKKTLKNDFI